jgi:hypothetical protein
MQRLPTEGLRLEQAPPLAVPMTFFLTAPLAVMAAGGLLIVEGGAALATQWAPQTLALTHLGTLGLLAMVMMGALYQITPVVAGSAVPAVRLAHAVHALFVVGAVCLVWGLARYRTSALQAALWTLSSGLLLFLVPVGIALVRAPTRNRTVTGMRLAVGFLLLTGLLGLWMVHGHSGMRFPGARNLWIQVHLTAALLGWVGGLIGAVSWQVIPMFYLAPPMAAKTQRLCLALLALGVLLPVGVLGLELTGAGGLDTARLMRLAAIAALPALLVVWGLHPLLTLRSLARRRRRRRDPSLLFWQAGLVIAPLTAGAAAGNHLAVDPRWGLLFGWLAIWSWAGIIVHGMLTRIVPFLVWLHGFAPRVGEVTVPSVRALLPDHHVRLGFFLHLASVIAGVLAIVAGSPGLARLAGVLVLATGASLARCMLHVLRQRPREVAEAPARAAS